MLELDSSFQGDTHDVLDGAVAPLAGFAMGQKRTIVHRGVGTVGEF